MSAQSPWLVYELEHDISRSGVAYYSPRLTQELTLSEALALLEKSPFDSFLYRQVLALLSQAPDSDIQSFTDKKSVFPILAEIALEQPERKKNLSLPDLTQQIALQSPEIELRSALLAPPKNRVDILRQLEKNIYSHQALPSPEDLSDFSDTKEEPGPNQDLALLRQSLSFPAPESRLPAMETYKKAMGILYGRGLVSGPELRHLNSLSPWGLLRQWRLDTRVATGRNDFVLKGMMTSYGRGLELEQARASLAMEMVERISAFASFDNHEVKGTKTALPLLKGTYNTLRSAGYDVLHPDSLHPEVPYMEQEIYWIKAVKKTATQETEAFIPAQTVFLFANLDEPSLFSAPGSTGLASGNTLQEAKLSALLEIIERDSEVITPYSPATCFRLKADGSPLNDLLLQYSEKGIDLCFQDITTDIGVPAFKAFVQAQNGTIVKATAAGLDSGQALISAMTEVPWPFPDCEPSAPGPQGLPLRDVNDFPDFGTGSAQGDLLLLETALLRAGHEIFYADITRKDIGLPVVRALVSGLDYFAGISPFSRLSPRLLANIPKK